jgi:hypothetical protein
LNLLLKESSNNVHFNYVCKYFNGMVQSVEGGIVQFPLDLVLRRKKTRGKDADVQDPIKSLKKYIADMSFSNFPSLLLVNPSRQVQNETKAQKRQKGTTTQVTLQELIFEEAITLKPHPVNPDGQDAPYTLVAFTVFSEDPYHYRVYCKGPTGWYLFDDDNTTEMPGEIALRYKT